VFDNKMRRGTFQPKGNEETGVRKKLGAVSECLPFSKYYYGEQIKEGGMENAGSVYREDKKFMQLFLRKIEKSRPSG
jgi:hypothetical protein